MFICSCIQYSLIFISEMILSYLYLSEVVLSPLFSYIPIFPNTSCMSFCTFDLCCSSTLLSFSYFILAFLKFSLVFISFVTMSFLCAFIIWRNVILLLIFFSYKNFVWTLTTVFSSCSYLREMNFPFTLTKGGCQ